jgi:hypothetical protein
MTTNLKRIIGIILTTDIDGFNNYMRGLNTSDFVNHHQMCIKNYYVSKPKFEINEELMWNEIDMEIISEKYRDFFDELGLEKAQEWLDYSELTMDALKYEIGGYDVDINDDELETANEFFNDLYYTTWSGWGWNKFFSELLLSYANFQEDDCEEYDEDFA